MRTFTYYAGCALLIAVIVVLLLAFTAPAHAQPPQLLPHTSASGPCELWEARYRNDADAFGWVHFEDVVIKGYRTCDDCDVVGKFAVAHFNRVGWTMTYYCVMRAPGADTVISNGGGGRS